MAPTRANWKRLIDNGNLIDATLANATDLGVPTPDNGSDKQFRSPQSGSGGGLSSDLLPVYCGALGCLIVGLVAWIVFKHLRRRRVQEDKQLPDQPLQPPAPDGDQHRQHHHHHRHHRHHRQGQEPDFYVPLMGQKRRSADSGFYGSEAAGAALATSAEVAPVSADIRRRLLRDLSESRLQRLENILANDPNPDGWRRLARELGLSAEDLAKLECQSVRGNQSAIRLMLKTWAARDGSSVGQLIRCLQRAGRSDAIILFRESAVPAGLVRRSQQRKMRKQQQPQRPEQPQQHQEQPPCQSDLVDRGADEVITVVNEAEAAAVPAEPSPTATA